MMEKVLVFFTLGEEGNTIANKSTDYKRQFNAEKYDRMEITVPKGKKSVIKAHAETKGKSLNSFVNEAIDSQIERDKENEFYDTMTLQFHKGTKEKYVAFAATFGESLIGYAERAFEERVRRDSQPTAE